MPGLVTDLHVPENKTKPQNNPSFRQKCTEQIYYVSFSPYEWSQDILCVVFPNKIQITQVKLQDGIDYQTIGEFNHAVHCCVIALSPLTSLSVLPKIIQFSTAGSDFKIRVYKSDLIEDNTCQILNGHLDFINDLSYDCESNYLASASDDQTARIWDTNSSQCVTVFYLASPGVSVCWHPEDCVKLMVCEKSGLIRYYNVQTQQPILSIDNGGVVSYAHWNPCDSQLVGALTQGEIKLWDLTRPSRPINSKVINIEGGGHMKFNQQGNLIAVINSLAGCLKVSQLQNGQIKLNVPVLLPTNVTWHFRLPVVCIGDDRELCFWKIDPN